jgi:hypothetical protein
MTMRNNIEDKRVDTPIEYGIRASARKVAKGLGGYDPGKGLMKKVNRPYYYMSGFCKQP